jgi:hypothetical protein
VEVEQVRQALAARSKVYSPKFWTRAFAVWGPGHFAMAPNGFAMITSH